MLVNWKTTLMGLSAVAVAVGGLMSALANDDWTSVAKDAGIIFAGFGAIFARDA